MLFCQEHFIFKLRRKLLVHFWTMQIRFKMKKQQLFAVGEMLHVCWVTYLMWSCHWYAWYKCNCICTLSFMHARHQTHMHALVTHRCTLALTHTSRTHTHLLCEENAVLLILPVVAQLFSLVLSTPFAPHYTVFPFYLISSTCLLRGQLSLSPSFLFFYLQLNPLFTLLINPSFVSSTYISLLTQQKLMHSCLLLLLSFAFF